MSNCARCGNSDANHRMVGHPFVTAPTPPQEFEMPLPNVTRIEVIDSTGRAFTRYYEIAGCSVTTQDGTRTLKVFANVPAEQASGSSGSE